MTDLVLFSLTSTDNVVLPYQSNTFELTYAPDSGNASIWYPVGSSSGTVVVLSPPNCEEDIIHLPEKPYAVTLLKGAGGEPILSLSSDGDEFLRLEGRGAIHLFFAQMGVIREALEGYLETLKEE